MKKQLLLAGLFLMFFSSTQASVVYTDITDITLNAANNAVDLDINNDGVTDFSSIYDGHTTLTYFGLDIVTVSTDEWDVIKGLSANTAIDDNAGFFAGGDAYINPFWGTYVFPENTDQYLGVRFIKNTAVYYGWIKVAVIAGEVVFKDFAYESVAETAINAGDHGIVQVPTSVAAANLQANVKLYPNPVSEVLHVESPDVLDEILVTDLAGNTVRHTSNAGSREVSVNIEELQNGLYSLTVRSGQKSATTKFYKKS